MSTFSTDEHDIRTIGECVCNDMQLAPAQRPRFWHALQMVQSHLPTQRDQLIAWLRGLALVVRRCERQVVTSQPRPLTAGYRRQPSQVA